MPSGQVWLVTRGLNPVQRLKDMSAGTEIEAKWEVQSPGSGGAFTGDVFGAKICITKILDSHKKKKVQEYWTKESKTEKKKNEEKRKGEGERDCRNSGSCPHLFLLGSGFLIAVIIST